MKTAKTWSTTQRGKPLLIDEENYEYRFNKARNGKLYYLCRQYDALKCNGMVFVKEKGAVSVTLVKQHGHFL